MGRPDRKRPSSWKLRAVGTVGLLASIGAAKYGAFGSDARYFANKALDKILGKDNEPPSPPAGTSSGPSVGTPEAGGGISEYVSMSNVLIVSVALTLIIVMALARRGSAQSQGASA